MVEIKYRIQPILRYEAFVLICLPIYIICYGFDISFLMKCGAWLLILACIYCIGISYSFTDVYLEKKIFGKKRKLLLKDICSVKHSIYLGTYIIQSKEKHFYFFHIDFSFQNKKKNLLFDYIKQANPNCEF